MSRRSKQSISTFLISVLGFLCTLKAFVWVMSTKVLEQDTVIDVPYLNSGIIVVIVLLVLRLTFYLVKRKARQSYDVRLETAAAQLTPSDTNTGQCAKCGMMLSDKVRDYCLDRPEKFNNQVFCYEHQR